MALLLQAQVQAVQAEQVRRLKVQLEQYAQVAPPPPDQSASVRQLLAQNGRLEQEVQEQAAHL